MKTVLLVDDSTTILASMEGIVRKAGYLVRKAVNAEQALKDITGGLKPDLVITDLNMPGMDGITLIAHLRKIPNMRFTPILMLTTESQQAKRQAAKTAGATGWLVKPVAPDQLVGVIKQVVPGA